MSDYEYENVEPDAGSVVESLRSIGYSLETAIADIIDNSIAANASIIKINLYWDDITNYIRIEDNGVGMSEKELLQAMKIGSKSPLQKRTSKDLGRFGMGLKTAAFSQCRRLSVMSKKNKQDSNIRCWDLDTIQKTGKWSLRKKAYSLQSSSHLGDIASQEGTVVLLEELDRFISSNYTTKNYNSFLSKINSLENHLSMVFHRFLSGMNSIKIQLNNCEIKPWDPYLLDQDATQELIEEPFQDDGQIIKIAAYVLPHHSKISKKVYEYGEGQKGWNAQQGFYIYRNKRLLVSGTWLNLFRKEEPYKLARVMIDITSESDLNWQIDIKKSTARPPQQILQELKRIGKLTRQASYRAFYHRGTKGISAINNQVNYKEDYLWEQIYKHGKSFFKLNRSHPLLLKIIEDLSVDERLLNAYLNLIEENTPINLMSYNPVKVREQDNEVSYLNEEEKDNILTGMKDFIYAMRLLNYSEEEILIRLQNIEPYKKHKQLILEELQENNSYMEGN